MKNASELRKITDSSDSKWVEEELSLIEPTLMSVAKKGNSRYDTERLLKPQVVNALKENGYTVEAWGGRDPRGTDGDAHHVISW